MMRKCLKQGWTDRTERLAGTTNDTGTRWLATDPDERMTIRSGYRPRMSNREVSRQAGVYPDPVRSMDILQL